MQHVHLLILTKKITYINSVIKYFSIIKADL